MKFKIYNSMGEYRGETYIATIEQLMELSLAEGDPLVLYFGESTYCNGYLRRDKETGLPTITVYDGYLE